MEGGHVILVIMTCMYVNRYVNHFLYLNNFVTIGKKERYNYDWNGIAIDFSIIFFEKIALDLPVPK